MPLTLLQHDTLINAALSDENVARIRAALLVHCVAVATGAKNDANDQPYTTEGRARAARVLFDPANAQQAATALARAIAASATDAGDELSDEALLPLVAGLADTAFQVGL